MANGYSIGYTQGLEVYIMTRQQANLEREFSLICLALYLQQQPEKATELAFNYYEAYMNLADDYKLLKAKFDSLEQQYIRLKSKPNYCSPSLPSFLNFNRGAS